MGGVSRSGAGGWGELGWGWWVGCIGVGLVGGVSRGGAVGWGGLTGGGICEVVWCDSACVCLLMSLLASCALHVGVYDCSVTVFSQSIPLPPSHLLYPGTTHSTMPSPHPEYCRIAVSWS